MMPLLLKQFSSESEMETMTKRTHQSPPAEQSESPENQNFGSNRKRSRTIREVYSMHKANLLCLSAALVIFLSGWITAQTTVFTYQGSLKDGASPANGNYDFEFKLFDLVSSGTQQGITLPRLNVGVTNGIFNVSLDFGAAVLTGADR